MKIPAMLEEYLESTEQNSDIMTDREILREAQWVIYLYDEDEWYATRAEARALKMFITKMKNAE